MQVDLRIYSPTNRDHRLGQTWILQYPTIYTHLGDPMLDGLTANALRFLFLEQLYRAAKGDTSEIIDLNDIVDLIGLEREQAVIIMRWLKDERLLDYATFGPTLQITHTGIRVVEDALATKQLSVAPFPPYNDMFQETALGMANPAASANHGSSTEGMSPESLRKGDEKPAPLGNKAQPERRDGSGQKVGKATLPIDAMLQGQAGIALSAIPDVPAKSDRLGFEPYVDAVAAFLLSPATQPPLTLSIEGEWGCGKSSFMELVQKAVRTISRGDVLCMAFNPWRLGTEDELWTSFVLEFIRTASSGLTRTRRFRAWLWLRLHRSASPENRSALLRTILLVVGFAGTATALCIALRLADPELVQTIAALTGSPADAIKPFFRVGSGLAVVAFAVFAAARLIANAKESLHVSDRSYFAAPDYANRVAFVERFHRDFDLILRTYASNKRRILVFVDDLDRCEPPHAANLVRAITMLIPENDKMLFVLGIDRDKIAAGMAAAYKDLLPFLDVDVHPTTSATEEITPMGTCHTGLQFGRHFVEKFVQLPFSVPRPSEADVIAYVTHLGGASPLRSESNVNARGASTNSVPSEDKNIGDSGDFKAMPDVRIEALKVRVDTEDSPRIREVILMLTDVLDRNPRRIKQFVNLFRLRTYVAHATGLFDHVSDTKPWTLLLLGKLVALELLDPSILSRIDQDPGLLPRLEDCALSQGKCDHLPELAWLRSWPRVEKLLRIGCDRDILGGESLAKECTFHNLDLAPALQTAPRIRDFPEMQRQSQHAPNVIEAEAHFGIEGGLRAEPESRPVSDQGYGTDAVRVERYSNSGERLDVPSRREDESQ